MGRRLWLICRVNFSKNFSKEGVENVVIVDKAVSGSLESSDLLVTIEPAREGIALDIESGVLRQYGRRIKKVVLETLKRLEVEAASVTVVDKGALDCTIRARVENAVFRAAGFTGSVPWGGVVRE
jgi:citrate lyase subunit gamma (acyl carrier protein)